MAKRPTLQNIESLSDFLVSTILDEEPKLSFFTGAGISIPPPSKLLSANEVITKIIDGLCQIPKLQPYVEGLKEQVLTTGVRMEELFEIIQRHIGKKIEDLLPIFSSSNPNFYHYFLASLIESGLTKYVVTTNFDQLIEKASQKNILVYASEEEHSERNPFCVYKIHGTVDRPETVIAMLPQVMRGLQKNKSKLLDEMFSSVCIVLGWSDNDIDLTPSFYKAGFGNLIWFDYNPKTEILIDFMANPNAKDTIGVHNKIIKILRDTGGLLVSCNPEVLFRKVWKKIENKKREIPEIQEKNQIDTSLIIKNWQYSLSTTDRYLIIGEILNQMSDWKKAMKILKECELQNLLSNDLHQLHYRLGIYAYKLLKWKEAIHYFEQSLNDKGHPLTIEELIEKMPKDHTISHLYGNVGSMLQKMGRLQEAAKCLKMDFDLSLNYGPYETMKAAGNYTGILIPLGEINTAHKVATMGFEIAKEFGDLNSYTSFKQTFAQIYAIQGNMQKAQDEMIELMNLYEMLGQPSNLIFAYNEIARICISLANFHEATSFANKALEIAKAYSNYEEIVNSLMTIGIINKEAGVSKLIRHNIPGQAEFNKSLEAYSQALAIMKVNDVPDRLRSQILTNRGLLFHFLNKSQKAKDDLQLSLKIRAKIGDELGMATILDNLALDLLKQNQPEEAEKHLMEALNIYDKFKHGPGKCQILNDLGGVYITKVQLLAKSGNAGIEFSKALNLAKSYFNQSLDLAVKLNLPVKISQAERNLKIFRI